MFLKWVRKSGTRRNKEASGSDAPEAGELVISAKRYRRRGSGVVVMLCAFTR
nr:hypothetical protein GCM10017611_00210 [Rhodococcus wratislaviensis]